MDEDACCELSSLVNAILKPESDSFEKGMDTDGEHQNNRRRLADRFACLNWLLRVICWLSSCAMIDGSLLTTVAGIRHGVLGRSLDSLKLHFLPLSWLIPFKNNLV